MSGDGRGEAPQVGTVRASHMLCSYCWQPVDLPPGHGSFHTCGHYIARLEISSCYGKVAGADVDLEESS
jgi:hypothetical protein